MKPTDTTTSPADAHDPMPRRAALRLLALAGAGALAACTLPADGGDRAAEEAATPEPLSPAALTTARGSFEGRSDHVTTGHARVVFDRGRVFVELEDDFTFDGAPDPKVGLGRDGYDPASRLGPLRADAGRQRYALPPGLDIGAYDEVWIWCDQFDVPLGVAKLTLT